MAPALPPAPPSPQPQPLLIPLTPRYTGHKNQEYKLDCCLSERDTHVVSCSEDGKVYFWDLVEVSLLTPALYQGASITPTPGKGNAVRAGRSEWEDEAGKTFPAKGTVCLGLEVWPTLVRRCKYCGVAAAAAGPG